MSRRALQLMLVLFAAVGVVLALFVAGAGAQENIPAFPTNTPRAATLLITTPDAPLERYALRLWQERDLVDVLARHVRLLRPDDAAGEQAVRLLQHELALRFPGAPRDPASRTRLLAAMLAAPRGSVDMRTTVHGLLQAQLTTRRPPLDRASTLMFDNFRLDIMPLNLDGMPPLEALVHARYPASATLPEEMIFEGFILAQVDDEGNYRLLETQPDYPAAPLGSVARVTLERLGDLNQDGLDEVAISVQRHDAANQELLMFGWRGDRVIPLVAPGAALNFERVIAWARNSDSLTVNALQLESAAWNCFSQREQVWSWQLNLFRPEPTIEPFTQQDSLACRIFQAEPLFQKPLDDALNELQGLLGRPAAEGLTAQRAEMTLLMLQALDEDIAGAANRARSLQRSADPGSWLDQQTTAFIDAASQSGVTPLRICAALVLASEHGACDVDQVLTRIFAEHPLQRGLPLEPQLERLGINLTERTTISEVGRFDRDVVRFDLAEAQWWAFAPLDPDVYTAERIAAPAGRELPGAPPDMLEAPPTAYTTLLAGNDSLAVLSILDNLSRDNPGAPLSPAARYLQALSLDLSANRIDSTQAYFQLWTQAPDSLWGQLAAAHLERR